MSRILMKAANLNAPIMAAMILTAAILGGLPSVVRTAQAQENPLKWLPPGSRIETTLAEHPARAIIAERSGGRMGYMARLGELVFRSPLTLGRDGARRGLSCEACHPNGATNPVFFVPGASDLPGNVDVTHAGFHFREDDGIANPVNIPSLRGLRWTAPYGHDGRFPDLAAFSQNVVTREFGGPPLPGWLLDALVAYQMELDFPLRPDGPADATADASAAQAWDRHCRACHGGADTLPDSRRYDIGTGGWKQAPPLFGLAETAPYLHDGSAATVAEAVRRHQGLTLTEQETAAVLRQASALGAVTVRFAPETLDGDLARLSGFLSVVNQQLLDENGARADRLADMVAMEIGRIYRRFDDTAATARPLIREWAGELDRSAKLALQGQYPEARTVLADLDSRLQTDRPRLATDLPRSLYPAAD